MKKKVNIRPKEKPPTKEEYYIKKAQIKPNHLLKNIYLIILPFYPQISQILMQVLLVQTQIR